MISICYFHKMEDMNVVVLELSNNITNDNNIKNHHHHHNCNNRNNNCNTNNRNHNCIHNCIHNNLNLNNEKISLFQSSLAFLKMKVKIKYRFNN